MLLRELRAEIVAVGRLLCSFGLMGTRDGNLSARDPERGIIAIKPSGSAYRDLEPEDVVVIDLDGKILEGDRRPSSETPMHTVIYRNRPEIDAVIHCHAPHAIAWSVVNEPIPAVTVNQLLTHGQIPISAYKQPGTRELGEQALDDLDGGTAIVLQNHGILCLGANLEDTLETTLAVEHAAEVSIYARLIGGKMRLMTDAEYRVLGGV